MSTFSFEVSHKRVIIFKAIENTSCIFEWCKVQIESLVKLVDGKLFRVARMKVDKDFKQAVQTDWRGNSGMNFSLK